MNTAIKEILNKESSKDYKEILNQGATVIDVRSRGEFVIGHIRNSINIPIEELPYNLNKLNKQSVLVVCCANGFRSAAAKSSLEMHGFTNVLNAGSWIELNNELQQ